MQIINSALRIALTILLLSWLVPNSNAANVQQIAVPDQHAVPTRPQQWLIILPRRRNKPGQPMQLRSMKVQARIVGLQAEVSTELTFFNPNHRQLEGELQFPLPDGAVITGYALDVNGNMVDGVIVKKQKARVAFETEVRRNVDPGIVEHVAGNLYKTRIYPLPARGTRRIRFNYVTTLPVDQQGDAALHYPMPIGQTIRDVTVRIEVMQGTVQPKIGGFGDLRFQSFANLWVAETTLQDAKPDEDIWVALPKLPAQVTNIERTPTGELYFAVSDRYTAPTTAALERPKRIGIAWDASGSRNGKHLQQEIAALQSLGIPLSVLVFRDQPETIQDLLEPNTLKDIPYDGGTDIVKAAEVIKNSAIEHWIIFSDGLDTLNANSKLPDFGTKQVTAVVTQTLANRDLLRQVCSQVIDLQRLEATAILAPNVRLVKIHGAEISDVQGLGARAIGRVNIYGKLTANTKELQLEYSDGHKSAPIVFTNIQVAKGTLLARTWAAQLINKLAVQATANAEKLLKLGRKFGIVSPETSLIVLENLDQYVRHDIEPPASLPKMRKQWRERKAVQAKQKQQKRTSKISRVLAMWRQRVDWWENSKPKHVQQITSNNPSRSRSSHNIVDDSRGPINVGRGIAGVRVLGNTSINVNPQDVTTIATNGAPARTSIGHVRNNETSNDDVVVRVDQLISLRNRTGTGITPRIAASPPPAPSSVSEGTTRELAAYRQRRLAARAQSSHYRDQARQRRIVFGARGGSSICNADHGAVCYQQQSASTQQIAVPESRPSTTTIQVQAWDPNTPYLTAIKAAAKARRYAIYLEQREKFATSPSFYLDCAEFFLQAGDKNLGIRILTNLAELKLEEASLLRVLAWRLQQAGALERAIIILRKVQKLRPEEPQSHRDLALALAEQGQVSKAIQLLIKVVMGEWQRFPEIEVIALEELNALIAQNQLSAPKDLDPRLLKNLDVDVRIVMVWDADATDVDLHVLEPSGEKAYYSHNRTAMGGLVSRDFTGGYGPEEYMVRYAQPGPFKIFAHYFGSSQQTVIGPTTVTATVFTNFGRSNQKRQVLTLRLNRVKDQVNIGTINIGSDVK